MTNISSRAKDMGRQQNSDNSETRPRFSNSVNETYLVWNKN